MLQLRPDPVCRNFCSRLYDRPIAWLLLTGIFLFHTWIPVLYVATNFRRTMLFRILIIITTDRAAGATHLILLWEPNIAGCPLKYRMPVMFLPQTQIAGKLPVQVVLLRGHRFDCLIEQAAARTRVQQHAYSQSAVTQVLSHMLRIDEQGPRGLLLTVQAASSGMVDRKPAAVRRMRYDRHVSPAFLSASCSLMY